jgi:glycosyltransferase involved in cell wall biosynthesis
VFNRQGLLKRIDQGVLTNGSGVDLEFFTPKQCPSQISFLLMARLIREKGIYEYAEAAQIIKEKYPEINFSLVGYIDEKSPSAVSRQDLQQWIESGTIDFKGFLTDVRPAIENSTIYVLPSYYPEGTPRSVLEAMAMGRPIITTDSPGCRETVEHGVNGFLIPKCDVPALVTAIEFYIENPAEINRMGMASRRIAEEKYDVHKVNAVILKAMELA